LQRKSCLAATVLGQGVLSSHEIFGEFRCQGLSRVLVNHYLSTANNWVKIRHFFTEAVKEAKEIN